MATNELGGEGISGAVRLGPGDRLVLVSDKDLLPEQITQISRALEERGLAGRAVVVCEMAAIVVPSGISDPEGAAKRVLRRVTAALGRSLGLAAERAVAEAVYAEVEDAGEARVALGKICSLVLDEGVEWRAVTEAAKQARRLLG